MLNRFWLSASKAQNIIDKAPSLLAELNPMYKEKARNRAALWQD